MNYYPFSDARGDFFIREGVLTRGSGGPDVWTSSTCTACDQSSVWRGDDLAYPRKGSAPRPHPDMPEAALSLYEEASEVLPISRRAAAALARASLETLLRRLPGANPKHRLTDLIAGLQGKVTGPLWQLLTGLRYIGNTSLHGSGADEDSPLVALFLEGEASEIVDPFFGAINTLVEELITQPAKIGALYEMIPESVRTQAEKPVT